MSKGIFKEYNYLTTLYLITLLINADNNKFIIVRKRLFNQLINRCTNYVQKPSRWKTNLHILHTRQCTLKRSLFLCFMSKSLWKVSRVSDLEGRVPHFETLVSKHFHPSLINICDNWLRTYYPWSIELQSV